MHEQKREALKNMPSYRVTIKQRHHETILGIFPASVFLF